MSVRKHPTKGHGWWYLIYYPQGAKGKQVSVPFQGTEAEARAAETELRMAARAPATLNFPKINELVPEFTLAYRLDHQPAGTERLLRSFKILLPYFGSLRLQAITPQTIEQYKTARLIDVKPTTINKELAALSSLIKWAEDRGYCQPIRIKRFPNKLTRAPIPTVPPKKEVITFIRAAPWPFSGLLSCLYYGGLRSAEARFMQAEHINSNVTMLIITGKGNKQRVVPLVKELQNVLKQRLQEVTTGYLWTIKNNQPIKDMRPWMQQAAKKAGIKRHYTPHLLRHAFGVHATEAGINLRSLQEIMGHSTSQVTEIYTRIAAEALTKEMKKF